MNQIDSMAIPVEGRMTTEELFELKNINKFNYWLEALPFYANIKKEGVVLSEC